MGVFARPLFYSMSARPSLPLNWLSINLLLNLCPYALLLSVSFDFVGHFTAPWGGIASPLLLMAISLILPQEMACSVSTRWRVSGITKEPAIVKSYWVEQLLHLPGGIRSGTKAPTSLVLYGLFLEYSWIGFTSLHRYDCCVQAHWLLRSISPFNVKLLSRLS